MKCIKCGAEQLLHRHHITYEPEYLALLCETCHIVITKINTAVAFKVGKLSNEQRIAIYDFFLQSELWIVKNLYKIKGFNFKTKKKHKKQKKKKKLLPNKTVYPSIHGWYMPDRD